MEYFIVCIAIWLLTFLLIPVKRVFMLRRAVVVSVVWMIFVDNMAANLDYYRYTSGALYVGQAPLFHLLGISGVGVLMLNWLDERPRTKLLSIFVVASAFSVLQYAYSRMGAFRLVRFDDGLCFVFNVAALSIFVWLSLIFVGENKIADDHRTRSMIQPKARP